MFQQGFSFSGYERDALFMNRDGKKFFDISGVSGIDSITDGRAAVFADFDNDGDYDVFGDGKVVLLSTPGHTPGHQSLYVKLARTGGVVVTGDLYHYTAERTITVSELRGMATTLTATAVTGASLTTVHVGDCRLLLLRDGTLTQLTKDHTWVAEQVLTDAAQSALGEAYAAAFNDATRVAISPF